jgi:hypothetical protein
MENGDPVTDASTSQRYMAQVRWKNGEKCPQQDVSSSSGKERRSFAELLPNCNIVIFRYSSTKTEVSK